MNEQVRNFLSQQKGQAQLQAKQEKDNLLLSLGLYEKEYSPENYQTEDYKFSEYDEQQKKYLYYKKIPVSVTDEEYEEIKKYSYKTSNKTASNPIATVLTVVGWLVFICGIIAGFALGKEEVVYLYHTETKFSITIALTYWVTSFFIFIMFLGFSEIIKLLTAINNKE